jgi:hypothetical protein
MGENMQNNRRPSAVRAATGLNEPSRRIIHPNNRTWQELNQANAN